jgi:hypothetical protein
MKKEKIALLLSWVFLLISINSYTNSFIFSDSFFYNGFKTLNIYEIISNTIFVLPFIVFSYLSYKLIDTKKKIYKFTLIFFLYGIWQLIVGIILYKDKLKINDYQIIFCLLNILLILHLSNIKKYYELFIKYLYISIIFISCIGFYFSFNILFEFITNSDLYYLYATKTLSPESNTFGQPTPRVTGISRILVVLFYFIFFYFTSKDYNKNYKIFYIIILFFLVTLILLMQSRMAFFGLLIGLVFYFLIVEKKLLNKIIVVIFIFGLPFITSKFIVYSKYYYNLQNEYKISNSSNYEEFKMLKEKALNDRIFGDNKYKSSGRIDIWNTSLKIIFKNKLIFGNGPQSDRKLIGQYYLDNNSYKELLTYGTNSSNAIIYSILCGGIISLFLLLAIYYLLLKILLNFFWAVQKDHKNFIENFLITTIIFLIVRSAFENSFAVFGVDFILISLCYYILILKKDKKIIFK